MQGMKMGNMQHSNMSGREGTDMSTSSNIIILNYAMMKAPYNTALFDGIHGETYIVSKWATLSTIMIVTWALVRYNNHLLITFQVFL
jgi:hypothetical protein